ncbi:MAG TPA: right-handed parallel beta-helix repeat-containing protein, partial [Thermoleophilaceae bacterium]|nr:right-handed parallel beta-helix repeat-containing protein [Thermoleophilaceae bacterium]
MRPSSPFAAGAAALAVAIAGSTGAGADDGGCTRVGSPGTSLQSLLDGVEPGDVACLHGGAYEGDVTMTRGGSGDDGRVVVRSFPGERAKIAGRLTVARTADYVTFRGLDLDGHDAPACTAKETCTRLPSPTVNGDHVTFEDNDVTNRHVGICFNLGHPGYGRPQGVVIQRNRIHDCGRVDPVSNHDHGIYLAYSDDTKILGNLIYDNADRGIQLYPDAQRTLIRGNVIDGNGEGVIFSGGGGTTSNDNVLENNAITNSRIRHDVETWWPDAPGHGNVVRDNCVFGGKQGEIADHRGYEVSGNLRADPGYRDRGGKDFRLQDGSPCAALVDTSLMEPAPEAAPTPAEGGQPEPSDEAQGSAEPQGEPEPPNPQGEPDAQGEPAPEPEPQGAPAPEGQQAEPDPPDEPASPPEPEFPPDPQDETVPNPQGEPAPEPQAAPATDDPVLDIVPVVPLPEPDPAVTDPSAATADAVAEIVEAVAPAAEPE